MSVSDYRAPSRAQDDVFLRSIGVEPAVIPDEEYQDRMLRQDMYSLADDMDMLPRWQLWIFRAAAVLVLVLAFYGARIGLIWLTERFL